MLVKISMSHFVSECSEMQGVGYLAPTSCVVVMYC